MPLRLSSVDFHRPQLRYRHDFFVINTALFVMGLRSSGEGMRCNVSINVSAIQMQRGFSEMLGEVCGETAVDPRCLQFEVIETTLMQSLSEDIEILASVNASLSPTLRRVKTNGRAQPTG